MEDFRELNQYFWADQDSSEHGGPRPDHQRVEGRGGEQGGRPVPRGYLLLSQIRSHQRQGKP